MYRVFGDSPVQECRLIFGTMFKYENSGFLTEVAPVTSGASGDPLIIRLQSLPSVDVEKITDYVCPTAAAYITKHFNRVEKSYPQDTRRGNKTPCSYVSPTGLHTLYLTSTRKCATCGGEFDHECTPLKISCDCIEPRHYSPLGYSEGNNQFLHWCCNRGKNDFSQKYWVEYMNSIRGSTTAMSPLHVDSFFGALSA